MIIGVFLQLLVPQSCAQASTRHYKPRDSWDAMMILHVQSGNEIVDPRQVNQCVIILMRFSIMLDPENQKRMKGLHL